MIKRSECRCICHTDAVALGRIVGPMHVMPCCEDDIGAFEISNKDGGYCPKCDTVWAAPGKCKCDSISVLEREIWNKAIEAALIELNGMIGSDRIRKLKK